jgi:hypothetical protein
MANMGKKTGAIVLLSFLTAWPLVGAALLSGDALVKRSYPESPDN